MVFHTICRKLCEHHCLLHWVYTSPDWAATWTFDTNGIRMRTLTRCYKMMYSVINFLLNTFNKNVKYIKISPELLNMFQSIHDQLVVNGLYNGYYCMCNLISCHSQKDEVLIMGDNSVKIQVNYYSRSVTQFEKSEEHHVTLVLV